MKGGEIMIKKMTKMKIGKWAFLAGFVIAILMGVVAELFPGWGLLDTYFETWTIALVIIGCVIGLLNVADAEVKDFLMSGTVLIVVLALGGQIIASVPVLFAILAHLLMIFVPAVVIVAIKNVFTISKN